MNPTADASDRSPSAPGATEGGARAPLRLTWVLAGAGLAGGVRSNRMLADAMVRRGHQVTIVYNAAADAWPRPWRVRTFVRRLRRELHLLGKQRHHLEGTLARTVPVSHAPMRPADAPDADVCIASWWQVRETIQDWPAAKGLKVYLIRHHELHGGEVQRVRATYRLPGLKMVVSHWLARVMAEEYDDSHAILIPNAVEHERFHAPPRARREPGTVGMLYGVQTWKGADTAFEALRRVQRQRPGTRVVSFGSQPMLWHHRPPANFTFHLRPSPEQIPELYRQADCWLVPSTAEGFGRPGLEAAACRCPLVSTRCGGPEDYVVEGENGHLVPVGDDAAMAQALLRVLECPPGRWEAMSQASARIAGRFNWDDSARKMEDALYAALGRTS